MKQDVFGMRLEEHEIGYVVVEVIAVDVMNYFADDKITSEMV